MVLGDGAVAAGALCHEISASTPGVAFILAGSGASRSAMPRVKPTMSKRRPPAFGVRRSEPSCESFLYSFKAGLGRLRHLRCVRSSLRCGPGAPR